MANRGGFSWKRVVGITKQKQRISRASGIPLSRSGRQRKVGKLMTGGCVTFPAALVVLIVLATLVLAVSGCDGGAADSSVEPVGQVAAVSSSSPTVAPATTTSTEPPTTTTAASTTTTTAAPTTTTTQAPTTTISSTTTTVSAVQVTVYGTKTGEKYHRESCSSLRRSKIPMTLDEATAKGLEPCKNCDPPV